MATHNLSFSEAVELLPSHAKKTNTVNPVTTHKYYPGLSESSPTRPVTCRSKRKGEDYRFHPAMTEPLIILTFFVLMVSHLLPLLLLHLNKIQIIMIQIFLMTPRTLYQTQTHTIALMIALNTATLSRVCETSNKSSRGITPSALNPSTSPQAS